MKKIFILAFIFVFFVACSAENGAALLQWQNPVGLGNKRVVLLDECRLKGKYLEGEYLIDDANSFIRSSGPFIPVPGNVQERIGLGYAVSGGGDVNGDGLSDFLIADDSGVVYLYYGSLCQDIEADKADAIFIGHEIGVNPINLLASSDISFGRSVEIIEDYNGDGFDDILIGAPRGGEGALEPGFDGHQGDGMLDTAEGEAYLYYGRKYKGKIFTDQAVHVFHGEDVDSFAGWKVKAVGDLNDDGHGDFGINAWDITDTEDGTLYILYGGQVWPERRINLKEADVIMRHQNPDHDIFARAFDGVGDLNGDGIDDLALSYKDFLNLEVDQRDAGMILIYFGDAAMPDELDESDADVKLYSVGQADRRISGTFGDSVVGAEDFNGDGFDDLLISESDSWRDVTSAYLVYGPLDGEFPRIDVQNPPIPVRRFMANEDEYLQEIDGLGDINDDGFADILIGLPGWGGGWGGKGAAYVVYGFKTVEEELGVNFISYDLDDASVKFFGLDVGDMAGSFVSNIGDTNGDRLNDYLISSPTREINGVEEAGAVSLFLGGK